MPNKSAYYWGDDAKDGYINLNFFTPDQVYRNGVWVNKYNADGSQFDYSKTVGAQAFKGALALYSALDRHKQAKEANRIAAANYLQNKKSSIANYGAAAVQANNQINNINENRAYIANIQYQDAYNKYNMGEQAKLAADSQYVIGNYDNTTGAKSKTYDKMDNVKTWDEATKGIS